VWRLGAKAIGVACQHKQRNFFILEDKMKCFIILTICISISLIGCSNKIIKESKPVYPTDRNYNTTFDKVWNSALKTISYFPLTIIEKNSGIINTDWITYIDTLKVNIWRGLIGGGQVDDKMPTEVMHRLNILVTQKDSTTVNVKIIRYAKARPYIQTMGGAGNWEPSVEANFEQVLSNTQTENQILNEIDEMLQAKK
jgi:hypothetical protein